MTDSITRCPKCSTSFRVNDAHLKTARGAVRCGSCLTIFNAREHLIDAKKADELASTPQTAKHAAQQEEDDILISDDMPIDDDDDSDKRDFGLGETLDENIFIAKSASKTEINLFERRIKDAQDHDNEHLEADESWALNLLEESDDEPSSPPPRKSDSKKTTVKSKPSPRAKKTNFDEERDTIETTQSQTKRDDADDYNAIFQVLEDESPNQERDIEPFPDQLLTSEEADYKSEFDTQESDDYFEEPDLEQFEVPPSTDLLESFEPEPLELHVKNDMRIWSSNYFWVSLNLVALLIVAMQVVYFKFDDWAKLQSMRPFYTQICHITGCQLPVLRDISKIKIDNMVVVNHPQSPGMLLVDATLQNRAKFDQHFPTLMLTFTNLSNELVSKFEFTPAQYVGGELAGKELMPPKHPIHITLEIKDPGENAVNYQISIVKP